MCSPCALGGPITPAHYHNWTDVLTASSTLWRCRHPPFLALIPQSLWTILPHAFWLLLAANVRVVHLRIPDDPLAGWACAQRVLEGRSVLPLFCDFSLPRFCKRLQLIRCPGFPSGISTLSGNRLCHWRVVALEDWGGHLTIRAHAAHGENITSLGCIPLSEELVSSGSWGNVRIVCRQRQAVWGSASSCVLQRSALVW